MPIYDLKCPACNTKCIDVFVHSYKDKVKCKQCGAIMKRLISSSKFVKAKCFPAEGVFLEHVSAEGKRFYSEKEMRQYEKDHNIEIAMLH